MTLTQRVKAKALDLGFDLVAIAPVGPSPHYDRYKRWVEAGYAGEMGYLVRHAPLKADPRALLPNARSLVLVGLNYHQRLDPALRGDPSRGQIAAYALGADYHKVMRKALIELDAWLRRQSGRATQGRVFVDSAPMLERSWAMRAGLGFIGKNTCLIHPGRGSDLFLGGLLTPEVLDYDEPPQPVSRAAAGNRAENRLPALKLSHPPESPTPAPPLSPTWRFANGAVGACGACTRCLEACPTGALRSPYVLDARLCISYLTIELRGEIPLDLRPRLGNWVFGCDLCQDICPWNRRARPTRHPRLHPQPERIAPPIIELLALSPEAFAQRFQGSAVMRAKWQGFMRNVCVASGNWGAPDAREGLRHHLCESPPLVAIHAAWALGRLRDRAGYKILQNALEQAQDVAVRRAISGALAAH